MKSLLIISLTANFLAVVLTSVLFYYCQNDKKILASDDSTRNLVKDAKHVDHGLSLYNGKFYFDCGDGELSSITNTQRREIVPAGASLVAIRPAYTIGYYVGSIVVKKNDEKQEIPKIFFSLDDTSEIEFFYPSESDDRFIGSEIEGGVEFLFP